MTRPIFPFVFEVLRWRTTFILAAAIAATFSVPTSAMAQSGCEPTCPQRMGNYDVTVYGADTANNASDDWVFIQAAIDDAHDAYKNQSGKCGEVYFPNGVYNLRRPGTGNIMVNLRSHVCLLGESRNGAILQLDWDDNRRPIDGRPEPGASTLDYASIESLRIHASRRPNDSIATGHQGIRIANGRNLLISDVFVKNTQGYGIGFSEGSYQHMTVEDVVVLNSGDDGIDFKNGPSISADILLKNILVRRPGFEQGKAGIDVRGKVKLVDITVDELGPGDRGIRFRHGEATPPSTNGAGGHNSSLQNFTISSLEGEGFGIEVGARNVTVKNGIIENVATGLRVLEPDPQHDDLATEIDNVTVEDSNTAFCLRDLIQSLSSPTCTNSGGIVDEVGQFGTISGNTTCSYSATTCTN